MVFKLKCGKIQIKLKIMRSAMFYMEFGDIFYYRLQTKLPSALVEKKYSFQSNQNVFES